MTSTISIFIPRWCKVSRKFRRATQNRRWAKKFLRKVQEVGGRVTGIKYRKSG